MSKRVNGMVLPLALLMVGLALFVSPVLADDIPDEDLIAIRTPETKIVIVGVAPRLINHGDVDTTVVKQSSSGLDVVGVGETVYLASSVEGTDFDWSVIAAPTGSAAAIVDAAEVGKMIVPDLLGDYTVQLVLTTADTVVTLTQDIVAAKYVGYESCNDACHASKGITTADWMATGHSSMLQRGLSGTLSSHYGAGCVKCHSLSSNTSNVAVATVDNDGFEDVAEGLGWTFPADIMKGTWVQDSDPSTPDALGVSGWSLDLEGSAWDDLPPELAKLAGIQCESCHGPGSAHIAGQPTKIGKSLRNEVCARCHDDGHYHVRPEEWDESGHASIWARDSASCSVCHTGSGFLLTTGAGLDAADAGVTPESGTFELGVTQTCATCHDPHSVAQDHQVRFTGEVTVEAMQTAGSVEATPITFDMGNGAMCAQCHNLRPGRNVVDTSIHHSHQTEMILGVGGYKYEGYDYSTGSHRNMENVCVTCHMSSAPSDASGKLGSHTWNMHDEELAIYNTVGCESCHGPLEDFNVNGAPDEIMAQAHILAELLPGEDGEPFTHDNGGHGSAPEGSMSDAELRAGWNAVFVLEDGSGGVHNPVYARQLVASSLAAIAGDAPAALAGDFDDNGKVDFQDMFAILNNFGTSEADTDWDAKFDLTENGVVGFADWLMFLDTFGNSAAASKPVLVDNGRNSGALLSLIGSNRPSIDQDHIAVAVEASNLTEMKGYSATITYDPNQLRFVRAIRSHETVVEGVEGTPGLTVLSQSLGQIVITDATGGRAISGDGLLADLVFELLTPADASAVQVDLAQVFDMDNGINQAVHLADFGTPSEPLFVTALESNYPNPFNPATTIQYSLADAGQVKIVLYSALGQEVRTIVDNHKLAGSYSVRWDGKDNQGQEAASGVYIYRMEADGFSSTRQMLLMK